MAGHRYTLPSSLIATDCPNVVTVTTKAIKVKSFHNHWFYLLLLLLDLILSCDSLSIFLFPASF
jgi:hypothetical protein